MARVAALYLQPERCKMSIMAIRKAATASPASNARLAAMRHCLDSAVDGDPETYGSLLWAIKTRLCPADRRRFNLIEAERIGPGLELTSPAPPGRAR